MSQLLGQYNYLIMPNYINTLGKLLIMIPDIQGKKKRSLVR